MNVRYIGPHDEAVVPDLNLVVAHGDTVEVDDEVGKNLLEQPANWEPVKAPSKKGA